MEFWREYYIECLQKPWMINAAKAPIAIAEPKNSKVFLFSKSIDRDGLEMLHRMVQALKYQPEEVTFLALDPDDVEGLSQWQASKKVLCFGEGFPGQFGDFINWYGHRVMKTNSVENLLLQPALKKLTWDHLKAFASLK